MSEYLKLLEADDHFSRLIQRKIKTGATEGLMDASREFVAALSEKTKSAQSFTHTAWIVDFSSLRDAANGTLKWGLGG